MLVARFQRMERKKKEIARQWGKSNFVYQTRYWRNVWWLWALNVHCEMGTHKSKVLGNARDLWCMLIYNTNDLSHTCAFHLRYIQFTPVLFYIFLLFPSPIFFRLGIDVILFVRSTTRFYALPEKNTFTIFPMPNDLNDQILVVLGHQSRRSRNLWPYSCTNMNDAATVEQCENANTRTSRGHLAILLSICRAGTALIPAHAHASLVAAARNDIFSVRILCLRCPVRRMLCSIIIIIIISHLISGAFFTHLCEKSDGSCIGYASCDLRMQ